MAHIRKTRAKTYQARYRSPDGREHARNFPRRVDAERFLTTVEGAKLRGDWTDPRLGRRRFAEWAAEVESARRIAAHRLWQATRR